MTLPDGPSAPGIVQGGMALAAPFWSMRRMRGRYGSAFTVNLPIVGRAVVISDPADIRQLFTASPQIADNLDINLGRVLGPGSLFALDGDQHAWQRKLLVPPFHGRRLSVYEAIVIVSIYLNHNSDEVFPNARSFDPDRFVGGRPGTYQWIPFGGGTRRCIGAAFAQMEMNVVLRTLLRHLTLEPTHEPGERWHSRGIAHAPGQGGRAVVRRRAGQGPNR
jgi:cytochrome P450